MKGIIASATQLIFISLACLLAVSAVAIGQTGLSQTTTFYFGKNVEGDVLMVASTARFDSRAPLGSILGHISGVTGEVRIWLDSIILVEKEAGETEAAPAAASTLIPPSGYKMPSAKFEIPLNNLTTGNAQRDLLLKSEPYLNTAMNPTATITLTGIQDANMYHLADNQEISLTASGEVTMRGISKRYGNIKIFLNYIKEQPLTQSRLKMPGDILHINAELTIRLSDFGIAVQQDNLLTIDDAVKVTFDGFGTTSF